jgi:N6-L-threonylcarbamoyladenine synthase
MDVAFSGLLTNLKQRYDRGAGIEDLAFSLQETAFAMVIEAAERALAHLKKDELLLGGGVACNSRLQEMAEIMCAERKAKFFCPPAELLVDNGGMIAYLGMLMFQTGCKISAEEANIKPAERTDDVVVNWR